MKENIIKDKIGLVLCGGGGKGAYEIGVWEGLDKFGFLDKVGAISGTSVGGLNAVLFALGDLENAKKIWGEVNYENMLGPSVDLTEVLNNLLDEFEEGHTVREILKAAVKTGKPSLKKGIAARTGLVDLIKKYVPLEKLRDAKPDVFVAVQKGLLGGDIEYKNIKEKPPEEVLSLLLATSSLPLIYGSENYDGAEYFDGGISKFGNTPVEPLYERGYRKIVIIALDHRFNLNDVRDYKNEPKDFEKIYPGCDFAVIKPSEDLGLLGMLSFSQEAIRDKIELGKRDAEEVAGKRRGKSVLKG